MAQIKISARALADLRFDRLAKATGLPSRWDALGRMIPVWNACAETGNPLIEKDMVDLLFGSEKAGEKMVAIGLAFDDGDSVRIAGYDEHCAWLKAAREGGKAGAIHGFKGGRPSDVLKAKKASKRGFAKKTPPGVIENNPPAINNYQLTINSISGIQNSESVEAAGPAELALACLAKITGVGYGSSKKHLALVAARLADGIPVADLIRIAEFCAVGQGWLGNSKMRPYLRPETLWGPESHAKYLDAARAWNGLPPKADLLPKNGVQLARGSQAPRKFRDYLSELAARTSESEKLLEKPEAAESLEALK